MATNKRDETIMRLALEEAARSRQNNEFPFGAVIVQGDKVVVRAENREARDKDVTAHAEMIAIKAASQALERRDLSDCVIYSSAEPCPMCSAAIFQANFPRVIFGLYREDLPHLFRRRRIRIAQLAEDWDYRPEVVGGVLRREAVAVFEGIERPWRVVGQHHKLHKPLAT